MLVLHDLLHLVLLKWTVFLFVHSSSQLPIPDASCDGESTKDSGTWSPPSSSLVCERLLGSRCGAWKQLQEGPVRMYRCCKHGHVSGVCRCAENTPSGNGTQIICTDDSPPPSPAPSSSTPPVTLRVNEARVSTNAPPVQSNQTGIYEHSWPASDKVDSNFHSLDLVTQSTSENATSVIGGSGNTTSQYVPSEEGAPALTDDKVLTSPSDDNKTDASHSLLDWASKQSNISITEDSALTYPALFDLNRTESTTLISGLPRRRDEGNVNLSYRVHSPKGGDPAKPETPIRHNSIVLSTIEDNPLFPTWAIALLAFIAVLVLLVVILYLYN